MTHEDIKSYVTRTLRDIAGTGPMTDWSTEDWDDTIGEARAELEAAEGAGTVGWSRAIRGLIGLLELARQAVGK